MMGNSCISEPKISMEPIETTAIVSDYEPYNRSFESYTKEQCCHLYDENGNLIQPIAETKIPFQNTDSNIKNIEQIMKKLEDEGTQVAINSLKDTTSNSTETADKLLSFMSDGAKRFEKETGRRMTYSEMRAMWG